MFEKLGPVCTFRNPLPLIRRNSLTYRHWQGVSRKQNDHLTSLLGWKMVQFFHYMVCEALWGQQERRMRRWEEQNTKKREYVSNESYDKYLLATLKNGNSLFKKIANSTASSRFGSS